jgi:hypothetical protein
MARAKLRQWDKYHTQDPRIVDETNTTDPHPYFSALSPARSRTPDWNNPLKGDLGKYTWLRLRYAEEMTEAEIATLLGCSIATVKRRMARDKERYLRDNRLRIKKNHIHAA